MYSRFSTISNQDCTRLLSSIGDFDSTGTFKRVNKLKVLENGFFGQIWPFMNPFITHCAICWNGSEACLITMCISGVIISFNPRQSQNMKKAQGAQSAGNQRPPRRQVSSLVGSSETTRATRSTSNSIFSFKFCQWVAGLIDGDGCFLVSKAGYISCEITIGSNDLHCLRILQLSLVLVQTHYVGVFITDKE